MVVSRCSYVIRIAFLVKHNCCTQSDEKLCKIKSKNRNEQKREKFKMRMMISQEKYVLITIMTHDSSQSRLDVRDALLIDGADQQIDIEVFY